MCCEEALKKALCCTVRLSHSARTRKVARSLLVGADEELPAYSFEPCTQHDTGDDTFTLPDDSQLPSGPLYVQLARQLQTSRLPTFTTMHLLDDVREIRDRVEGGLLEASARFCAALKVLGEKTGEDTMLAEAFEQYITSVGLLGVCRLLGLRLTAGTLTAVEENMLCPPPLALLEASFNVLYLKSKLSVGGKALAKHTVRHESWWGGELKGKEHAKSAAALGVLRRILANPAWVNLHMLPHGKPTYEVRIAEGYGARWSFEPRPETEEERDADAPECGKWEVKFRGFLEPQQEDGHDNKWRH